MGGQERAGDIERQRVQLPSKKTISQSLVKFKLLILLSY